jgi:fucose permease
MGANEITWAIPTSLGDYLLAAYFEILKKNFEQKSLISFWKFLKIFMTLLCYGLLLKNSDYNVFKVLLSNFHSLDWFKIFKLYISIYKK